MFERKKFTPDFGNSVVEQFKKTLLMRFNFTLDEVLLFFLGGRSQLPKRNIKNLTNFQTECVRRGNIRLHL